MAAGRAGHFLRQRQITIHNQRSAALPSCSLPTIARPVSHLSPSSSVPAPLLLLSKSLQGLPTYTRSLHTRIAQRPQPPGTDYFRQASALSSISYYNRVILRVPSAPAHAPSHHQHSDNPNRLVLGRCITASPFSRNEPDPVLLRRRPFARLAPTRPVTQPPQWHLYCNTTPYDSYQRPFVPQFVSRHGVYSCVRRFQGLDGCQQPKRCLLHVTLPTLR